jgi:hypothetical protein
MDSSKLLQMQMDAANNYKAHRVERVASEVTQIKAARASAANSSAHRGPSTGCCPKAPIFSDAQPGGFSTTYSYDPVRDRTIGNALCCENPSAERGRYLKTEAECAILLEREANPNKSVKRDCCASTEVVQRGIAECCPPSYTGWLNQVPRNPSVTQIE